MLIPFSEEEKIRQNSQFPKAAHLELTRIVYADRIVTVPRGTERGHLESPPGFLCL